MAVFEFKVESGFTGQINRISLVIVAASVIAAGRIGFVFAALGFAALYDRKSPPSHGVPRIAIASEVRPPPPPPKPPDPIPPDPALNSSPIPDHGNRIHANSLNPNFIGQIHSPALKTDQDPLPRPNSPARSFTSRRRGPAAAALLLDLDIIRVWSNPRTSPSEFFNLAIWPLSLPIVNLAPQFSIRSKILWIMLYAFIVIVLSGCVVWFVVLEIEDGMFRRHHKIRRWVWVPGWREGQVLSRGFFMIKIWDPGKCLVHFFLFSIFSPAEWGSAMISPLL